MNMATGAGRRRLDVAVVVLCCLGAAVVFLLFHALRHDDAFITYRYALNLVEGDGLVFNPGERVLGTTSPLFALLCAVLYAIVGKGLLPAAAVVLNSAALGVQAYLLYLMIRRALPVTAVAVAVLTLAGAASPFTYLGLETHTFVALLLAAVWGVGRDRPVLGGVLTGLAFLARHDAALLVPLLLLRYRRAEDGRRGLRFLAAAAAPVLPWLLFATVYYGWPLPRTLQAKSGLVPFGEYLAHHGERLFLVPGLSPSLSVHAVGVALAGLGLFVVWRHLRELLVVPLFALLLLLVYAWIGPPPVQGWHMHPVTLAVGLLMILCAAGSLEVRGRRETVRDLLRRRTVVASVAVLWLLPLVPSAVRSSEGLETSFWLGGRHARYDRTAAWLLDHAGPDRSLLAVEVGTLGYLTGYQMVDPFGLVTPTRGAPEDAGYIIGLMRRHRPDLVPMHAPWQGRFLEAHTPYRTIHVFPWFNPWSTLLIRQPTVLARPRELPRLRRRVERFAAPDGSGLGWPDLRGWRGAPAAAGGPGEPDA